MNSFNVFPALCVLLAPAAIVVGCGGGVPGGAIATVDGESWLEDFRAKRRAKPECLKA